MPHLMVATSTAEGELDPRNAEAGEVCTGVRGTREQGPLLNLDVLDKLEPAKFGPTSPKVRRSPLVLRVSH